MPVMSIVTLSKLYLVFLLQPYMFHDVEISVLHTPFNYYNFVFNVFIKDTLKINFSLFLYHPIFINYVNSTHFIQNRNLQSSVRLFIYFQPNQIFLLLLYVYLILTPSTLFQNRFMTV